MGRETSPYIVGEFWLDKRRDGKAPDIWQIASYRSGSRSVVYLSTKRRTVDLEGAKAVINAHHSNIQATKGQQRVEEIRVIPQLILYVREKKGEIVNIGQSKSSMRVFIGFLMQDEVTPDVTFSGLTKSVWNRFIQWRRGPHSYEVEWADKLYAHESPGVSDDAINRNLDDIRAALNHAVNEERVAMAPRVPSIPRPKGTRKRRRRLTIDQLGAIVGYARQDLKEEAWAKHDKGTLRWIYLMLGTAVRPDAALAFNPMVQDEGELLDMHPPAWPLTDKVNPHVRVIDPLRPVLDEWKREIGNKVYVPVKSRKRWWRTMRRALGLPGDVVPKSIRHTLATMLRARGVPGGEISGILGHHDPEMHRTSSIYAIYDPAYQARAKEALTDIWREVHAAADKWDADHLRTKTGNNASIVVPRGSQKPRIFVD